MTTRNIYVDGKHYRYTSAHRNNCWIGILLRDVQTNQSRLVEAAELFAPLTAEQRERPWQYGGGKHRNTAVVAWIVEAYIKSVAKGTVHIKPRPIRVPPKWWIRKYGD